MISKLARGTELYLPKSDYKMLKEVIKKTQNTLKAAQDSSKNAERVCGLQCCETKPWAKGTGLPSVDTVQEPKERPSWLICVMCEPSYKYLANQGCILVSDRLKILGLSKMANVFPWIGTSW